MHQFLWNMLDWLYPPVCGGCGIKGVRWCSDCQESINFIRDDICKFCGVPLHQAGTCKLCQSNPPPFTAVRACAVYQGAIRSAIHRLKFKNDMGIGETLSKYLIEKFQDLNWQIDMVVPVPLSQRRKQERGYNQASLLGWPLSATYHLPFKPGALERKRETIPQVGLSAKDRFLNIENAFNAYPSIVLNKNVLVIDDVTTTSATMRACASALRTAGAVSVYGLTLAKAVIMDDTLTAHGRYESSN